MIDEAPLRLNFLQFYATIFTLENTKKTLTSGESQKLMKILLFDKLESSLLMFKSVETRLNVSWGLCDTIKSVTIFLTYITIQ